MQLFSLKTGFRFRSPALLSLAATFLCTGFPLSSAAAAPEPDESEIVLRALEITDDLEVSLFASAPQLFNPVAFTIDEQGRFFISETHRYKDSIFDIWAADQRWKDADASFRTVQDRADFLAQEFADNPEKLTKNSEIVRLVEDRDGDGKADFSAVLADGFNEPVSGTAAGVLASKGVLWFTNIPDLWRFEYDESGTATKTEKLHTGYGVHIGVSGHDLHGLVLGPDGKLYFSVGDRGARVINQEGALLDVADTGAVFRCDPDGSNLKIFAIGLRNPQELAFDRYGNLWAHDNDTAGQDKSRMIHVVEGGDYGWRYSYQFMQGFGPWVQEKVWAGEIDDVLPNAGLGAQGPSGLAYYPGVGLPERYDHHFIAADFPKGALAYTVHPRGASYEIGKLERMIWNAGITDVAFGPDGHVYFSDWGRSYQMPNGGHIYRLSDPEQEGNPALVELKAILAEGMANRSISEIGKLLGHQDMRVRQEAHFELAARAENSPDTMPEIIRQLEETVLKSSNLYARIHAIWALKMVQPENSEKTFATLLEDPETEIRAQAAETVAAIGLRKLAPEVSKLLADPSPRVRAYAATGLGKLAQKEELSREVFLAPLFDFLRENSDRDAFLTHAGMMALLDTGDFSLILEAASNESPAVRRVALLAMRRLERTEIVQFLEDPNERIRYEAIRAINDAPIHAALPDMAKMLDRPAIPATFLSRLINANFREGTAESADRIARFAARSDVPTAARVEALKALGDWETPAPRDRVIGLWRPLEPRGAEPARTAFTSVAKTILLGSPEAVQTAAVETAAKLQATEIGSALFALLQEPNVSLALRRSIPATLVDFEFPRLSKMLAITLADEDLSVRQAGIELLDQIEIPQASQLLLDLLASENDLSLSQTAIATLGRIDEPEADVAIAQLMDQMLAGDLRRELHLDLIEAAGNRSAEIVRDRLDRYAKSLDSTDPTAPFQPVLAGGDATLGKKLFYERDDLGCARCHSVGGQGGTLGPDLAGIGTKRSRQYLLESILQPNKHFAPGYEHVVLALKNGETIAGTVAQETAKKIVLTRSDNLVAVQKDQIARRHPSISTMPPGLEKLMTKREFRDVIEYLASLEE